jgi:hypothetical protein
MCAAPKAVRSISKSGGSTRALILQPRVFASDTVIAALLPESASGPVRAPVAVAR